MSKKSKKGKTIPLTDFLAAGPKLVTVRESTWAAIVDEEEEKKLIVVDMSALPTAPRASVDIDYSTVPNNPPYVAHIANLSFEIDDESLRRIFADLNPKAARIMRNGNRSLGVGLVEFDTRENLIEALKRTDKEVYGRKIRIKVSDKTDSHQTNFNQRSNRSGEERPEMADRWKRVERKSEDLSDERPRTFRNDQGRSNFSGNSRDNQRGGDYGFGYPRTRDDRQGPRHDNNRPNYGGRYSDTRDTRDQNTPNDDNREPPKERPRLQLQPRSKPLEEVQTLSGSSASVNNVDNSPNISENSPNNQDEHGSREPSEAGSSLEPSTVKPITPSRGAGASIFGGAKPVDTAAKELEIERKLQELRMAQGETNDDQHEKGSPSSSSRPTYQRNNDRDTYRHKRTSQNDGRSTDYHHRREYSGGRRYEDDSRRSTNDDDNYQRRDRDHYKNLSRRDQPSGKYNHHDRDNYQHRNRETTNESTNHRRLSDDNFQSESSQSKTQPRTILRRPVPTEDASNKLELSNKFGMLNDDDVDDEDVQSPTNDE